MTLTRTDSYIFFKEETKMREITMQDLMLLRPHLQLMLSLIKSGIFVRYLQCFYGRFNLVLVSR